jgi:SAM-dependent methyltransferase
MEGLKFLVAPVGYWRLAPFMLLEEEFHACNARRVLDVSSPKLMSLRFAALGAEVIAADLDDDAIFGRWLRAARALKLANYSTEFVDARRLPYPDNSFDLTYSISVIEHIPENGDSVAIDEMLRVVRPGGKVVIEVPFRHEGKDVYRNHDSKGTPVSKPMFFERQYDERMVVDRLVRWRPCSRTMLGETLALDPWISGERKMPKALRIFFLPLEPLIAMWNYGPNRRRPLAMYMVFEKGSIQLTG